MSTRKRSLSIDLHAMRKSFALRPLALGVASVFLSACSEERYEGNIYTSVDDCRSDNPVEAAQACETAYQLAVDEANRTGPKYATQYDCEYEFGEQQCHYVERPSGSFFMPFIAGYMVSRLLSPKRYFSHPMYTSTSRYSPFRNRWMMADGHIFDGDIRKRKYRVNESVLAKKPSINRTISRGGFGNSVRAKSNWSGSSRISGWGS